ncbi:MAG: acyl-CoA thioesterase [Rhodococcus sp. (in: high G+C Gram-positive bacteria)]|uniref:acyl-CoA thioesterase n=1 Tax=unclassified Rhodococcus (in: high G+C Gram-positive bacteria) TaxID=192944 RepID=UPI00095C8A58|nr:MULTISPECIES: acyl-CoA thioesterase [unclassified Rhodococcus (in: high G+C Gram-positive bacteria)]MCC8927146.1 acyl-CoA thioesterase [Rhodococcus sp. I2R]OLT34075.1 4-hydroxybenzoyl-CoA thioesterase [Rhodococcus sp. CUA-806]
MSGKVFEYSLQVRWSDSDRLGHVNNTRFVEYLQEARAHFITQVLMEAVGSRGATVVRRLTVDFLRPIFDESGPLVIEVSILRIGRTSFQVKQRVLDVSGALCSEAEAVMVAFDLESQTPRALTDREKSVLAEYEIAG